MSSFPHCVYIKLYHKNKRFLKVSGAFNILIIINIWIKKKKKSLMYDDLFGVHVTQSAVHLMYNIYHIHGEMPFVNRTILPFCCCVFLQAPVFHSWTISSLS